MGAEMMLAGYKFPQPKDVLFGRTLAAVGEQDIPTSLLQQLDAYVQQLDVGIHYFSLLLVYSPFHVKRYSGRQSSLHLIKRTKSRTPRHHSVAHVDTR